MSRITLIATGHREIGIRTSSELFKIIEQINPDIIFEEIPPSKFKDVYEGRRSASLEVKAIKAYLEKYPATLHLPVDLEVDKIIEKEIKRDFEGISFIFGDYSYEYNYLSKQLSYLSETQGFPYLNSEHCTRVMERQHFLEKEILKSLKKDATQKNMDHEKLSQEHQRIADYMDNREEEMIKNIYKYFDTTGFENALFLVGTHHRKPIMQKISDFEKNNNLHLNWVFNYFKLR